MKNIGILGYGIVGQATARHLSRNDRQMIAFDRMKDAAETINAHNKVPKDHGPLDALFVCISVPPAETQKMDSRVYAAKAAGHIMTAIIETGVVLREGAPILVRSTVPVGTCDTLGSLYPNNPVLYWPEYSKEASMRNGYEVRAPYLGLPEKFIDCPIKDAVASSILKASGLDYGIVYGNIGSSVVTVNKHAEFGKLAYNVKRAADVALFNELVNGALNVGITLEAAHTLVEINNPAAPHFATLAFGGKCLRKDTWIWDTSVKSPLGSYIRKLNELGLSRMARLADRAHMLLDLDPVPVVLLGLQDGPASGMCHNSPALWFLKQRKWLRLPYCVDASREARDRFWFQIALRPDVPKVQTLAPDDERLDKTNCIVVTQHSRNSPAMKNALLKILQTSTAEVKLVINACNMPFTERDIIECVKWGAVFMDQIEFDRRAAELERENKLPLTDEEVTALPAWPAN